MAESKHSQPAPDQVRRGRRMAMLLFAVGFGPIVFATVMFYTGWLNPQGQSNHGVLIDPTVPVSALALATEDGEPLAERFGPQVQDPEWLMLVVAGQCGEQCEQLLYLARQVNIALGKNADRMNRAAYLEQVPGQLADRWASEYATMERLQYPESGKLDWPGALDLKQGPRLLLVDPFGNIMMQYGPEHSGKEMLKDLKHLMKLSQIG